MKRKLPFVEAIAVLVGTTIGAGILGIPYVVAKAGFLTGLVDLLIIASAVILVDLFLGEIVLSTKNKHQLTGYAEKYLGKVGKYLMFFSVIFGFYGALLAYIIGEGEVLAALTGGSALVYSLLFFCFASLLVYVGLTVVKRFEVVMTLAVLTIVIIIAFKGFYAIDLSNLAVFNWQKLFFPYGVIFFAMAGASAIPQLRECLRGKEKLIKPAIGLGVFIPFLVYLIFMFIVVGITGFATTEVATIGLGQAVGGIMVIVGNLFACFTMATSFLTLGLALKDTYRLDLKLGHFSAWALACLIPLIIFLLGLHSFIKVIGTVGAIGGGIEGLLILAIYIKLKSLKQKERTPEYYLKFIWPLIILVGLMFLVGIAYALVA